MVNNKGWEVCRWWNGTKLSHSPTTFFATVTLLLAIVDLDKSRSERVCCNGRSDFIQTDKKSSAAGFAAEMLLNDKESRNDLDAECFDPVWKVAIMSN